MHKLTFPEAFSLRDEHALITGGGTGIGLAVAQAMHAAGARVTLIGRREAELAEAVRGLGDRASYVVHDITRFDAAPALIERIVREHGPVTCLVNNAGKHLKKPAIETTPAELQDVMGTHIFGAHALSQAVIPGMIERGRGHIVNIGSIAGHEVYPGGNVYCATKFAVRALSKGLRLDLNGTPIRVSEVAPGMVETEFSLVRFHGDAERAGKVYQGLTPLAPDDVADAVVWCATRPLHVNVSEVLIMPTAQASTMLVSRKS
jgi:3-hydroxy acid dehydrogenase/malonic semialdehyde reductase